MSLAGRFFILHNPDDAASRAFVAQHEGDPAVAAVFDWYDPEHRELWAAEGGTESVGGFPAVVYDSPEYDDVAVSVDPELDERRRRPRIWQVENVVRHMDEVKAEALRRDALAAVTWVEAVSIEGHDDDTVEVEAAKAVPYLVVLQDDLREQIEARMERAQARDVPVWFQRNA